MKKLLYSCTLLTMWVLTAKAQPATQQQIKPEFSPAGVYVKTGVIPARGETVIISRDMGKGFEVIGNLTAPENQAVLYQRMQGNSLRLPNYYSVTEQLAGTLWQLLQAGKKDSILHANIPVMLMGLGAAYLDTTKNLPEATRYQVQLGTQSWESGPLGKRSAPVKNYNFFSLAPAAQVIRAQWRVQVTQRPPLFEIQRKKLGIDSNFTKLKTDLGFEKTKRGDSLSVHLSDTTVLPGISYSYVLTGKDFLGRIIGVSDTIRSIAGNRTSVNGIDRFTTKTAPDSTGIMLQWNRQNPNAIRSIRILRSAYYDSTYVQVAIVTPTDTTWTDRSAAMGANYYYQVIAQGNGDFAYPSPRVFGSFMNKQRMLAPSALASQKSEAGIKLNWKYGTYMNLLGFRMYRALGNSGKFMPISDVLTATRDSLSFSFVDRDKSLIAGEFYTYAVAAIGRNYVESPLSAIAQVNYVEKTRLQAPTQLRALMVNDSTVSITWQDLSAIHRAVRGYHIFRKALGADSVKGFKRLTNQPTVGNEFVDTLSFGNAWQYVVQAVNQSDSSNFSLPTVVRSQASRPLPPGKVQLFAEKNSVIINWDGSLIPNVVRYNIYRASSSTPPVKIGTVTVDQPKTFQDKNVASGELFYYYLTTQTNQGQESEKSREVSLRLK